MTAPKDQTMQISNALLKKVEELLYNEYNGNIKEYRKALNNLRTSQNNLNMKYGNAFLTPFPTSEPSARLGSFTHYILHLPGLLVRCVDTADMGSLSFHLSHAKLLDKM